MALLQTFAEAFDKLERKEAPRDLGGKVRLPDLMLNANFFLGPSAEAEYEEGGAGVLFNSSSRIRDSQGWSNTYFSKLWPLFQNHLVDIFTDFREDKEASGRGREEDEEKESFYD